MTSILPPGSRTDVRPAPYHSDRDVTLYQGDAATVLATLPEQSVNCVVTSPPYFGLRDYGVDGQLGLEASPAEYVAALVEVFRGVRRVLRDDGVVWLNLGDSYSTRKVVRDSSHQPGMHADRTDHDTIGKAWRDNAADGNTRMPAATGLPEKNLLMIPARVAIALQDDGWYLRNDNIWNKPTAMPEPVQDRMSSRHEHIFMLTKSARYWFDLDAIREPLLHPDAADGTRTFGGVNKAADLTTGSSARRTGNTYGRPQRARAEQIAREKGLTPAHFEAIRACGMSDAGKAASLQTGTGKNRPEVQALADEAKAALGGYYREFLTLKGKNPGDVWTIAMQPFPGAHFATFPPEIPRRCILSSCPNEGTVLDPFTGSGTTGMVARQTGRNFVGVDLNATYLDLAVQRIGEPTLDFGGVA